MTTDISDLTEIYNQAILSNRTADLDPFKSNERMQWFESHQDENFPIYVVENDRQLLGYVTLSQYRGGRGALKSVVEISYYVHSDFHRRGVGTFLLQLGLNTARTLGYKTAIAILLESNKASISLLEKFGFEKWGHMPDVAEFGEERCGHMYYGRRV